MYRTFLALLLLTLTLPVAAEPAAATYDRVRFSVSSGSEVANDTLVAVLYAQQEGPDAGRLAKAVNTLIGKAVARAKTDPAIQVQTLNYTTSPRYRKQELDGWRVRQSLQLRSPDAAALGKMLGELQQTLKVAGITYTISPASRRQHEERLIGSAIRAFGARAAAISREMGRSGYRLVEMNIGTGGQPPRPRLMRTVGMAASNAVPPTLEAGSQRIEVSIDGTIELKP